MSLCLFHSQFYIPYKTKYWRQYHLAKHIEKYFSKNKYWQSSRYNAIKNNIIICNNLIGDSKLVILFKNANRQSTLLTLYGILPYIKSR